MKTCVPIRGLWVGRYVLPTYRPLLLVQLNLCICLCFVMTSWFYCMELLFLSPVCLPRKFTGNSPRGVSGTLLCLGHLLLDMNLYSALTMNQDRIESAKVGCRYSNVGRDGALVESIAFNRRVVGSTPALAVTRDLGQVLFLQLPVRFGVKLRYSIRAVVGSASEW